MEAVRVLDIQKDTHNVMHIITEKPKEISFTPGQATEVAIVKPKWEEEKRPFTFTSLPEDDFLEFFIKVYTDHDGVTEQIGKLNRGDTLKLGDVFGAIEYKGEGVFIAGGAGVTPFISILKSLANQNKIGNNKLIFGNKKEKDIINHEYFKEILGDQLINVLSEEEKEGYKNGYITKEIIQKTLDNDQKQYIYLCGPPKMMDTVQAELKKLNFDEEYLVKEDFS